MPEQEWKQAAGSKIILIKVLAILAFAILFAVGIQFWLDIEYTDPMFAVAILPYEAGFALSSIGLWFFLLRSEVPVKFRYYASRTNKLVLPLLLVPLIGLALSLGLAETIDGLLIAKLAVTTVFIGIAEEMYFRGIGFGGFRAAGLSPARAIIFSALIFSLFHLSNLVSGLGDIVVFQLLNTFLLGLVFGYVYHRTRNLGYLMLIHFAWDFGSLGMRFQGPQIIHTLVTMLMLVMSVGYGIWAMRNILKIKGTQKHY